MHRLFAAVTLLAAFAAVTQRHSLAAGDDRRIDFRVGGELVTTYNTEPGAAKPYLWPLKAPGGVSVTRGWPLDKKVVVSSDHPHQVSAWFCHGDVDGVDFWSLAPGHGVITCVHTTSLGSSRVGTRNEWRTAAGRTILNETRTLAVRPASDGRLIEVDIDLDAAPGSVVFGDTKEGAFAVRVHDQLRVGEKGKINPKSRITNADGKEGEKACWGYPSNWCDYSGEIDGKAVGIAIFDDPANRPRACWHVRDYGLMAANPFGRAKSGFPAMRGRTDVVKLGKGEHLKLRYGIFLHDGDATAGRVADAFERFVKLKD